MKDLLSFEGRRVQFGSPSAQPYAEPAPAAGTPAATKVIACSCGCSWQVTRTELPQVISEHMVCLCGKTLMDWVEAADYRFEPLEAHDL